MLPWGGLSCCLGAAALYLLGRNSGRDAEVLKSVTRVSQLKDLAGLLDTAIKVLPFVITASGRVGSDTPINCKDSGLQGVIVEVTAEQHFLKHNEAGSWIQDSALMLSGCEEASWYLDDGTGRVYVIGARGATGLVLAVGSEKFEESGQSIVRGTLDYLQGLKMLGIKRTERVLPVGMPLTVVGEAVKDDIGTVRIQRPHKGPFYVTHKTIDQLIAHLGKWARLYKYASMGLTLFGAYLLAKHAFQYVMERRCHWELRKRLSVIVFEIRPVTFFFPSGHALCLGVLMSSVMSGGPVAITRTSAHPSAVTNDDGFSRLAFGDLRHPLEFKWAFSRVLAAAAKRQRQDNESSDGKAENGSESDSSKKDRLMPNLCVICLEQEYNSVFVPCGHMCCCTSCSSHLTNCPLCRGRIEQVVRTFRH
ncbi:hypothetical protein RHGRI_002978 [Rhododendron griersonianum]|uniref:RING-type E3 ubiquitin transferase n=1 Tax=Rhododendron griersonianum TaxID=479676 RepID=A0AAV6LS20_9ERIC|nr:hypothetical protein RHGRI_002978 [Rhododendron griersonianum]